MSDTAITYAGGTASVMSFGSTNPAVMAIMSAMISAQDLPLLTVTQAKDVQVQAGGSMADRGFGIA